MVEKHYGRLLKVPETSFFLLGMRGVGKSTFVRELLPSAPSLSLLHEGRYQNYLARPESFAEDLRAVPKGSWVVVDEIQRLPGLLNEVHRFMEERRLKFALLGSSARKLRRAGVNLLGGRALRRFLHPLLPEELATDFSLTRVLETGSIPLIWGAANPQEQLEGYVQLYLKEEIQAEAIVRNLPGFARFLPVAALYHGQVLNLEALGRQCGVARSTAEGYLEVLEDTLLCFTVPAYEKKLRVRQRQHPKLYFADSGVARAAKKQMGPVANEERGVLFEGFIAQVLRAYGELGLLKYDNLSYWSAGKNSIEVDFLIQRDQVLTAIEVKSGTEADPSWYRGLIALKQAVQVQRAIIVYLGTRRFVHASGIEVLPVGDFLAELRDL